MEPGAAILEQAHPYHEADLQELHGAEEVHEIQEESDQRSSGAEDGRERKLHPQYSV